MTFSPEPGIHASLKRMNGIRASVLGVFLAGTLPAQPLYAPGHFPSGPTYAVSDLLPLANQRLPDPCYVTGKFLYLGNLAWPGQPDAVPTFVDFVEGDAEGSMRSVHQAVFKVRFPQGLPSSLTIGQLYVATPDNPLTLRRVLRTGNARVPLVVDAECQSEP